MNRLRVCFLIQGMSDGGAQKQCIYLLNELAKRDDIDLHLLYFFPGVHDSLLNRQNITIERLDVRSNYDPLNIVRLRRMLGRIQPHVLLSWLHACDTYSFFIRRSMPSLRWVMTERNSFYAPDIRFWLRRQLGRYADGIISNSLQGDRFWQEASANGMRFVIPNIVLPSNTPQNQRGDSIVHVGRLEPQKNVAVVVRAFCILAQRRADLSFLLVGDGSLRAELEELVQQARLSSRIKFVGFRADAARYISAARAIVSMSHHEGLPNVLLESVVAGTPIIASAIPEHRDLLGPDYKYYVEKRDSPEDCADVIERVLVGDQVADLEYANSRLSSMTPGTVAEMYVDAFRLIASKCP